MALPLTGISSMATRLLLAEVGTAFERQGGRRLEFESVGGVDAARRVQAGERFDIVVLACDAIDRLIDTGRLAQGSRVDLVRSPVAMAVRAGTPRLDVSSEAAVRQAVLSARSLGYSTGPSGVHLARQFERWGIAEAIKQRIVLAPPGVPVGTLLARGEVEFGFQQLSELMHQDGIVVMGTLPEPIAFITTFSAGLPVTPSATPASADAVRDWLAFMTSPLAMQTMRRHGLEPA